MSLKLWHFIRVAKKVSIVIYCGGVVALTEDNETDFFSCLVEIFHFYYLLTFNLYKYSWKVNAII